MSTIEITSKIEALKELAIQTKAAGIMLECIQGEGGVLPLTAEFVKAVADFCKEQDIQVSCTGHTHIDVAWRWTLEQTREKVQRTFGSVIEMMKKYPDYRIVCLDKLTYAGNLSTLEEALKHPNFQFFKADICDRAAIYAIFEAEKPDAVVHFAAESHVDRSIEDPEEFIDNARQIFPGTDVAVDSMTMTLQYP